ncbi:MAG: lysine transporter LysE [Nitrospinaceae bacterium]|nr:MAG: lysine transporter LysE [Nitrospinaceae bacterium]
MQTSMTFSSVTALFGAMIVLAAVPSVSVLSVSARSAAFGFTHGVFTTLGIVVGDIIYILLAIYGLSVLADTSLFVWLKYLGGTYLIWLGIALWRSKPKAVDDEGSKESSWHSSFLTGLLITLGDQKAVLFYLVFFPAFIDLTAVTILDTGIIIAIATITIGVAKLSYAYLAVKAGGLFDSSKANKGINIAAGMVMIGVGVFLVVRG